ncbi:MAG: iron ABC transporter permease [Proteobacteria bacterium]|nr:iron ABC transporter permease [Pseudomonadota bacterium]
MSRPRSNQIIWLVSLALLLLGIIANVASGSADVSAAETLQGFIAKLQGNQPTESAGLAWTVFAQLRLPRTLTAAFVGAALAVAGVLAQGLFREHLASPTVLGSEAGGSVAAAVAFYLGLAYWHPLLLPLAAFAGASAATGIAVSISGRGSSDGSSGFASPIANLMLSGFAINALLGAATSLLITVALEEPGRAGRALAFLIGGFQGKGFEHVAIASTTFAVGLLAALRLARPLDVLSLGEETASSLSIDTRSLRRWTLAVIGLLVAGSVSAAGALPFVGLMVPHVARHLAGPSHRQLLALSAVQGACLVLFADLMARHIRAPAELPASILTAMLGAPFFLMLLSMRRSAE